LGIDNIILTTFKLHERLWYSLRVACPQEFMSVTSRNSSSIILFSNYERLDDPGSRWLLVSFRCLNLRKPEITKQDLCREKKIIKSNNMVYAVVLESRYLVEQMMSLGFPPNSTYYIRMHLYKVYSFLYRGLVVLGNSPFMAAGE
jgi:hypothetical protein